MASMIARRPVQHPRPEREQEGRGRPSTVTGAFSHAIANMRKPPRTVTGSFSGVVAGRAARRRQAVESAPLRLLPEPPGLVGDPLARAPGGGAPLVVPPGGRQGGRRPPQFCGTASGSGLRDKPP